jgi:hypothetical protein
VVLVFQQKSGQRAHPWTYFQHFGATAVRLKLIGDSFTDIFVNQEMLT